MRRLDILRVVGRTRPVEIHEIYDYASAQEREEKASAGTYLDKALYLRSQRKWAQAIKTLGEGLALYPKDTALLRQLECIESLQADPPSEGWDGSVAADSK